MMQDFNLAIFGEHSKTARWEECAMMSTEQLPMAVGALYIRKYFDLKKKTEALVLFQQLLAEIKDIKAENTSIH